MKTIHSLFLRPLLGKLIGLSVLLASGCSDPIEEDLNRRELIVLPEAQQWQDALDELLWDGIIIVRRNSSIQKAVNMAQPDDAIYIEAGLYREAVTIGKSDITLIGVDGSNGEKVIIENPENKTTGVIIHGRNNNVNIINIQYGKLAGNVHKLSHSTAARAGKRTRFIKMTREQLTSGVAHYQFEVRLGKQQYDVVRIHRVVSESRPYHPVPTQGEVFMVHGASQDFDDIFLTAGAVDNVSPRTSSPVYLAAQGIDVWGIDLAWTLVPEATNDFTFMQEWGVERDVDHTLAAMTIARLIRGLTGQGLDQLNLLGFSYGVPVIYAAAGRETQKHPILRNIKGIIPAEAGMKYDPANEDLRQAACGVAAGILATINGGIYASQLGIDLAPIGALARTAPNDPSPFPFPIPGLTNSQVAMAIGAGPNPFPAPNWHFVAGEFNKSGIPLRLLYTAPSRWFYLLATLAPFMPQRALFEFRACQCDEEDVSIDDYLDQIAVPILYLGAGGGFGTLGDYTAITRTASTDVTTKTVSLQLSKLRNNDFGHADMFMAGNAPKQVWGFLHQWLVDHHTYQIP